MGSLTQIQRSIIIGTLLGDGYLRCMPGRKDSFLEVNHSAKAREYVDWKFNQLKTITRSAPKQRKSNGIRIAYRFFTRQHSELSELHKLFYFEKLKIVPDIALDPIALAVWFMDDGSRCGASDVYLNTQQFVRADQERLISYLGKMGICAKMNKDKKYYRLRIIKSSLDRFFKIISPYIIPSMRYKLGE